MNYNELSRKAHRNAVSKGFWEIPPSYETCLMLVITELSEAVEADRKGRYSKLPPIDEGKLDTGWFESNVKDTVQDEMADIAIRLGDLAGRLGIDFDRMNEIMYVRSFQNFRFPDNAYGLAKGLTREYPCIEKRVLFALDYTFNWASSLGIDLDRHIRLKMNYNESRPKKHNKNY